MEKTIKTLPAESTISIVAYIDFPSSLYITVPEAGVGIHITDFFKVMTIIAGDDTGRLVTGIAQTLTSTHTDDRVEFERSQQAGLEGQLNAKAEPLDMTIAEGHELAQYTKVTLHEELLFYVYEDAIIDAPAVPAEAGAVA